jgi:hypothetical protein
MVKPFIIAESLSGSDDKKDRVTLLVKYAAKEVRIDMPIATHFDREPGVEVYRRSLLELVQALNQWQTAREEISWPNRR